MRLADLEQVSIAPWGVPAGGMPSVPSQCGSLGFPALQFSALKQYLAVVAPDAV